MLLSKRNNPVTKESIAAGIFEINSSKYLLDDKLNNPGEIRTTASHEAVKLNETLDSPATKVRLETNFTIINLTGPYSSVNFPF